MDSSCYDGAMKFFCLACLAMTLGSCNTFIGVGRDMREGYHWSKRKVQESRQGSAQGQYDSYGPVY